MRPSISPILAALAGAALGVAGATGCSAGNNEAPRAEPPAPHPSPRACTEIGCIDGLHVTLTPGERWPAGAYAFDIQTDGGSTSCRGSLPLPPCGTPGLSCSGQAVQIGESGCALPAAAHGFSTLTFPSTPKRVHVRITRESEAIAERELQPVYQRVQPNGPGCEPVCTTAGETLRVF